MSEATSTARTEDRVEIVDPSRTGVCQDTGRAATVGPGTWELLPSCHAGFLNTHTCTWYGKGENEDNRFRGPCWDDGKETVHRLDDSLVAFRRNALRGERGKLTRAD